VLDKLENKDNQKMKKEARERKKKEAQCALLRERVCIVSNLFLFDFLLSLGSMTQF